jgi:RimJ/RimL family protein N-acetyltransferase
MDNPSERLRRRGNPNNYPGFDHPLTFAPIGNHHREAVIKALWTSHKELRGFIGWAQYMRSWSTKDFNRFIDNHINARLPDQHFVFMIGKEIVGMGSLLGAYTPQDHQIALWVSSGYQGKGIGQSIVHTLEDVAFNVWGYHTLYYEHDSSNESSKKLPQKCGFKFSHTRNLRRDALKESGLWFSWKKERPDGLPDAIIQGRPIEDFTKP